MTARDRRAASSGTDARGTGAGFSLIEVVFALTFLAVGILAVAAMIPAGTRGVSQSRVITSGLMASQVKLEQLRGTEFMALTPGTFSDTVSVFTRTWTVTDSIPMSGCKRIKVTSSWNDSRGSQTTTLTSYVSR